MSTTPDSIGEAMNAEISRRKFLTRTAWAAGGALVIGYELAPGVRWANAAIAETTAGGSFGVYVSIAADNTVTLVCPGSEMGQGISTALPMILAEEMKVKWSDVRLQLAFAADGLKRPPNFSSQSTGGSNSVRGYHSYLRNLGAEIRQKMIWAASSLHSVPVAELRAFEGEVVHDSSGSKWTFASLAPTAATMTPNDVVLTAKENFTLIGTPVKRLDIPSKVNGSAVFGIDVRLEGMKYASVILAPKVGQTVKSVSTPPAGVTTVILTNSANQRIGVAAVTDRSTWDAINAARGLRITWNNATFTPNIDSALMKTRAESLMATGTATVEKNDGDVAAALSAAPTNRRFNRTYSAPYLAHATMEVQNATALVTNTSCEIWAPTQTPTSAVNEAVAVTGLTTAQVTLHTTFLGGGFGRRLSNDYVRQAAQVAATVKGTPVKLVWSREEDFTHDVHRPASLATFDAAVDGSGALTALKVRVVCGHSRNSSLEGFVGTATAPTRDILYTYPSNYRVEFIQDTIEVPLGFWRSVGHSQNCFFFESFLDEIATGINQDPIAFRRSLLASGSPIHVRANAVLDKLVQESGWNTPAPSGRARGVALTMGFGDTIVGQVAEISGTSISNMKVEKVTVVVDAGSVINPDTVAAQMEGSIIEGLGAALFNSVTFRQGTPDHRNFNTYRMIKMSESPAIKTVIIESGAAMGGIGEPGLPPIAPAVANALAKLNGTRLRSMPLTSSGTTTPINPAPTITSFTPTSGPVGTNVVITGTNFTGATRVAFGGTSASGFTVVSATQINVAVPRRARSGPITVVTAAGTATSPTSFTVR